MFEILARVVDILRIILSVLLFARVFLSWIPNFSRHQAAKFIYQVTEPILFPVRKLVARSPLGGTTMMIDFSPIIVFILLDFISNQLIRLLISL